MHDMRGAQNSSGTPPRVGRPFRKALSSNPGGRPKGLARAAGELVGEDGMALVKLWWQIAQDPMQRTRDRLEASRLLADRGWGKPLPTRRSRKTTRLASKMWRRLRRSSGRRFFGLLAIPSWS
jgi:hypothetical protein